MFQVQDPAQMLLAQTFMQGMDNFGNSLRRRHDTNAFNDFMAQTQAVQNPFSYGAMGPAAMMMGPQMAQPPVFPEMYSPFGQALQAQYMQSRLAGLNPLNPLQDAERQKTVQQGRLYGAQADALTNATPEYKETDPRYYTSQGYSVPDAMKAARTAANLEAGPKVYEPEIWRNKSTGEIRRVGANDPQPQGLDWELMGRGGTTVNVNPPSAEERKALAEGQAGLDELGTLYQTYQQAKTGGGWASSFPGPVQGPLRQISGTVGATSPATENFLAASSSFKNKIIKLITGAQMSEPEARRIVKQIPQPSDIGPRWEAKFRQTQTQMEALQRRYQEAQRKSGLTPIDFEKKVQEQLATKPTAWAGGMAVGDSETRSQDAAQPLTATNPATGAKIMSTDGGKTWQPMTK